MMVINLTDFSEKSDQLGYIHNEAQNALALMELAANYSSWSTRCKRLAEYCVGNVQREIQRLPSEQRSADEVQKLLALISQQFAVVTVCEGDSDGKARATHNQQPPSAGCIRHQGDDLPLSANARGGEATPGENGQ